MTVGLQVVTALESGTEALRGLTSKVNVDRVADIMDNVREVGLII